MGRRKGGRVWVEEPMNGRRKCGMGWDGKERKEGRKQKKGGKVRSWKQKTEMESESETG